MLRLLLMLCLAGGGLGAADDLGRPADPNSLRQARELQQKFQGRVSLPSAGSTQAELLLALAETGSAALSAPASNASGQDYDALYAILQSYRDDLLKLGLDQEALDSQMSALRRRVEDLEARVDAIKPKDGMKIHGRIVSLFDDLHVIGPGTLAGPGLPKLAGQGQRYQQGYSRSDINLLAVRGPVEAGFTWSSVWAYGNNVAEVAVRDIFAELRLPVVLQVGNIFQQLTPLTLWRNEDPNPFEPTLLRERRQRLKDDVELRENRWRLPGIRASTDMVLFDSQKIELQAMAFQLGVPDPGQALNPGGTPSPNYQLAYNTYLSAWRVRLPLPAGISLGYTGTLVWDVAQSSASTLLPFSSQVQSGEAGIQLGIFELGGEFAASALDDPNLPDGKRSGAAFNGGLGLKGSWGSVKATARQASDTFVSAPAQGRTEMPQYAWLGPFPTESSQVNAAGNYGLLTVPLSPETRLNTRLIPPETLNSGGVPTLDYLLPYDWRTNAASPYGLATPNRQGYGFQAATNLGNGLFAPSLMADFSGELKGLPKRDFYTLLLTGGSYEPMLFSTLGGGFSSQMGPLKLEAGYTVQDIQNGNALYGASSTLVDLGLSWKIRGDLTLSLAGRHLDANGTLPYNGLDPVKLFFQAETFDDVYDLGGAGLAWRPMENTRLDVMYSVLKYDNKKNEASNLESDQGQVRVSVEF
jgi:hypothetical protein